MNERIKELAEQVGFGPAWFEESPPGYPALPKEGMLKKFAELIVRECTDCADFVGQVNIASGYPNSTAHHVKQKIKQHFGVEE